MNMATLRQIRKVGLVLGLVAGWGLSAVGPAWAQDERKQNVSQALAAALLDSVVLAEGLVDSTATALQIEPVNLWDTGVNATGAVLMTPLFPGWGQLYARNGWRGALSFGVEMYYWTNMLVRDRRAVRANDFGESLALDDVNRSRYRDIADENWEQMRDFAWWSGGALLLIALDSYVGAHLFNFDSDPVPVPDRWEDTFGSVGDAMPGSSEGPTVVVFQWRKTF